MPSASSKSSQPAPQLNNSDLLQEPMKHAVSVLEKKLRNLEKRKIKLLETKKKADEGNQLNEDQKKALENLTLVESNLDLVKELHKNMGSLEQEFCKLLRKDQKRIKLAESLQAETNARKMLCNVVEFQAILGDLTEEVHPDFLTGSNGACQLTVDELANLDSLYQLVNPNFEEEDDPIEKISIRVKRSSEHLVNLIEGKDKPVLENKVTYKELVKLLSKIQESGYFDKDDAVNGEREKIESDDAEKVDCDDTPEELSVLDQEPTEIQSDEVTTPDPPSELVNGVDLPPEIKESPEEETINFLSESEITVSSDDQNQPILNPVSPEFVPRTFSGDEPSFESEAAQSNNAGWEQAPPAEAAWQSVESQGFQQSGGGYRGNRGGRGGDRGRGFGGRGGRGRGNFRGNRQDGGNFRGGNRGNRGPSGNRGGFRGNTRGGPRGGGGNRGNSKDGKMNV